jgi:hypothetical protein
LGAGGGKYALHHNYPMQRSADTKHVEFPQGGCAPADAGRYAVSRFATWQTLNSSLNRSAISFILFGMSEETTQNMPDGHSFEERVFARLDSIDTRLQSLENQAERRALETKPIWERALQEIMETRRELSKRLDRIEAIAHETRADLRDAEDRIESLASKSS